MTMTIKRTIACLWAAGLTSCVPVSYTSLVPQAEIDDDRGFALAGCFEQGPALGVVETVPLTGEGTSSDEDLSYFASAYDWRAGGRKLAVLLKLRVRDVPSVFFDADVLSIRHSRDELDMIPLSQFEDDFGKLKGNAFELAPWETGPTRLGQGDIPREPGQILHSLPPSAIGEYRHKTSPDSIGEILLRGSLVLPEELGDEFTVQLPAINIDGQKIRLQPVRFLKMRSTYIESINC